MIYREKLHKQVTHVVDNVEYKLDIYRRYHRGRGRAMTSRPEALHPSPPWWEFTLCANSENISNFDTHLEADSYLNELLLIRRRDGLWETHCGDLPLSLLGMGFGSLLYREMIDFAIKTNKTPCSSHTSSESALAVWDRLDKEYYIFETDRNRIVLGTREAKAA